MMRCGKSLGTLDWVTDVIYLMRSTNAEKHLTDDEYLDGINKGAYIQ